MPPRKIPMAFYLGDTVENVKETFDLVTNATNSSVATGNNTVLSLVTKSAETVTLRPLTSFNPEIWAPPDDGEVYRLNTPLNAPEPSLDPVTGIPSNGGLLGSTSADDLGWIIPTAVVVIAAMVGVAFLFYFGVRALELRLLGWCYRNCSCCCKPEGHRRRLLGGEKYDHLSEDAGSTRRKESVRLKEFRERSLTYGVSRTTSKEYTPPANPFDDD